MKDSFYNCLLHISF